jgi:ABC-type multidrug transport system permease subunit
MDVFKELLKALIPLIKQSPLYLISVIVMTIEGMGIQTLFELYLIPDSALKKFQKLPLRTWMMLFFGIAWTALWLCFIHVCRIGWRPITQSDIEATLISGFLISTACALIVFVTVTLIARNRV